MLHSVLNLTVSQDDSYSQSSYVSPHPDRLYSFVPVGCLTVLFNQCLHRKSEEDISRFHALVRGNRVLGYNLKYRL